MSLESAVLSGRAAADALMLDLCVITRAGGEPVWDPATNDYVTPLPTTVYDGRCKVQTRDVLVTEATVGERELGVVRWEIHLPVAASGGVARDDVVEVTSSVLDGSLVGRKFVVKAPHVGTAKTARRLPVEAVV